MDGAGLTRPWNPLRCDGTPLPPDWLLAAKLLTFSVFPGVRFLAAGPPFLPFVPVLDSALFAVWLAPATAAAFYTAFACLMVNRLVRTACLVIAACLFVHIAGHRLEYANNQVFIGVLLLVIGLYDDRTALWPLRIQLALVYTGSSMNKALDPDWWNGRYFDTLMIDALDLRWYAALAERFPDHALGACFGALTILTEASIASAMLVSPNGRAGVVLMLLFHLAMLVATLGQLSLPFLYACLAVSAPFLNRSLHAPPVTWWLAALFIRVLPRILGRI